MVVAKERGGGAMPSLQNSTNSHRISTTQMYTFTSPQEAREEDKKDPSNKPGVSSQWSLTRSSKAQVEQTQTGTVFKAKPNATKKTERCHNAPFFPPETSLPNSKVIGEAIV